MKKTKWEKYRKQSHSGLPTVRIDYSWSIYFNSASRAVMSTKWVEYAYDKESNRIGFFPVPNKTNLSYSTSSTTSSIAGMAKHFSLEKLCKRGQSVYLDFVKGPDCFYIDLNSARLGRKS